MGKQFSQASTTLEQGWIHDKRSETWTFARFAQSLDFYIQKQAQ